MKVPKPAAAMTTKQLLQGVGPGVRSVVPGATATRTVLNSPATKGLVKAGGRKLPVVGGLINAGLATYDVSQGADPMRAYGRAATEMAGGALGAGAAGLLAIPSGPGAIAAGIAGYAGGSTAASAGFDALFPEGMKVGSLDGKRSIANMGGVSYDLSTPEGERGFSNARKAALKVQTDKGVSQRDFGSDYKAKEAAAFRAAAEAGDPQTESIRSMTGTDTSSGLRDAPPKELSEGMRIWAEAHPELAAAAYAKGPKQSGYDTIEKTLGLSNNAITNYDADQTFKPSDLAEADRQDPTKGRTGLKDMQSRAKLAMNQMRPLSLVKSLKLTGRIHYKDVVVYKICKQDCSSSSHQKD